MNVVTEALRAGEAAVGRWLVREQRTWVRVVVPLAVGLSAGALTTQLIALMPPVLGVVAIALIAGLMVTWALWQLVELRRMERDYHRASRQHHEALAQALGLPGHWDERRHLWVWDRGGPAA
jgi:uncharacterized membrane protein YccC